MSNELQKAIWSNAVSDASLNAAVIQTGNLKHGIFYGEAPEADVSMPYIIFSIPDQTPEHNFNGSFENAMVRFTVYDDSKSAATTGTIIGLIKAAFDRKQLTYSTKTAIGCLRSGETQPERLEDAWRATVDYEVLFTS